MIAGNIGRFLKRRRFTNFDLVSTRIWMRSVGEFSVSNPYLVSEKFSLKYAEKRVEGSYAGNLEQPSTTESLVLAARGQQTSKGKQKRSNRPWRDTAVE